MPADCTDVLVVAPCRASVKGPFYFSRNRECPLYPYKVTSIFINGGAVQRSIVSSVQINFDALLVFAGAPEAAFTLVRQSDSMTVTTKAIVDNSGPSTFVWLTFVAGAVNGTSLADGKYTLTIVGNQFASDGFDGNSDGTAGDNFTLVGTAANTLFRLFGDADGDGDTDAIDFGTFRSAFGTANYTFDFDNDGDVDATDFGNFRLRFGVSV